jgi:outer membrane protein assembly factor BamB
MWTAYHRDAQRSGYDTDVTNPREPVLAWQTVNLGAPIWSQPLVLGGRVYVATVGDALYALEASTGKVVWERSLGTPVPPTALPCPGDIEPTVGVVGTPVIDPATQTIYAVADTWDANTEAAHHVLEGLRLSDGERVLSTDVDPPGADPKALLQRTALNLDGDEVVFGFGGNDGDCGAYRGAVVAAPENGGPPRFWQYAPAPPSSSGGAVWSPGGQAVDAEGDVYAATGNPNPPVGEEATVYDYSDSVVKLNPAQDFVAHPETEPASPLAAFEPPTWKLESNTDLDLGSGAPEMLPGGVLFQAGKSGTGYLLDEHTMASVYSAPVCAQREGFSGSFGGDAFAGGVLYIPCENGTQALAYNQAERKFAPLWQGPSDAVGPPIVSAGLVWTVATGKFSGGGTTLYGLDPASGTPVYTETLPSGVADHFASPSAAGGRLFVSTGSTVSAYQVGELPAIEQPPSEPPGGGPPAPPSAGPPAQTPPVTTTALHKRAKSRKPARRGSALCRSARHSGGTRRGRSKGARSVRSHGRAKRVSARRKARRCVRRGRSHKRHPRRRR